MWQDRAELLLVEAPLREEYDFAHAAGRRRAATDGTPVARLDNNSNARLQMNPRLPRFSVLMLIFSVLTVCASLRAHHGNAAYDDQHPITIAGNVTEFVWSNPHCQIYLDVKDAKGQVVSWSVESQSPGILKRNGWTRDSIKQGDHIAVTLIPAKSGAPVGFSGEKTGKIVFDDGHVLKMDLR